MDILNKVRNAIKVMRKFKEDNRMTSELKVSVAEDVFDILKSTGMMTQDYTGRYFLDNVPVYVLHDEYPEGYVAVE